MRLALLSLLLLLVALAIGCCPLEDRWGPTAEACADELADSGLVPAEGCADALLADFQADRGAFAPEDEDRLILGLWTLFSAPAGQREDLRDQARLPGPLPRRLARAARRVDTEDLRAASWDLAAAQVASLRPARFAEADWRAAYDRSTGEILLRTPLDDDPQLLALLLFHESMHGLAAPHVACPEDPDDACDRRWSGAWGMQAGYADLLLLGCDPAREPDRCALLEASRIAACGRVLASGGDPC